MSSHSIRTPHFVFHPPGFPFCIWSCHQVRTNCAHVPLANHSLCRVLTWNSELPNCVVTLYLFVICFTAENTPLKKKSDPNDMYCQQEFLRSRNLFSSPQSWAVQLMPFHMQLMYANESGVKIRDPIILQNETLKCVFFLNCSVVSIKIR